MATLHKFVDGTPTSLTVTNLANYNFLNYHGWQTNGGGSAFHIQYVDVSQHLNESIEIVLPSATTTFFNNYNFATGSSSNPLTVITPPTPTIVDGKYHYVFPAGTFTYAQVAPLGPFSSQSGNNRYYNGMDITSASASGDKWEDVDIPNFNSGTSFTIQTFNTEQSSYPYSYLYLNKYTYYIGSSNQSSYGKIKYFELPSGITQFWTTSPSIAQTTSVALGSGTSIVYPTTQDGNKYYYQITYPQWGNYILLSGPGVNYDGTAGIDSGWDIGILHARTSGSWT